MIVSNSLSRIHQQKLEFTVLPLSETKIASAFSIGLHRDWAVGVAESMIVDGLRGSYAAEKKSEEKSLTASTARPGWSHYFALTILLQSLYGEHKKKVEEKEETKEKESKEAPKSSIDSKEEKRESKAPVATSTTPSSATPATSTIPTAQLEAVAAYLPSIGPEITPTAVSHAEETTGGKSKSKTSVIIPPTPKITIEQLIERSVLKPLNFASGKITLDSFQSTTLETVLCGCNKGKC